MQKHVDDGTDGKLAEDRRLTVTDPHSLPAPSAT
jgi:hypothetical protein